MGVVVSLFTNVQTLCEHYKHLLANKTRTNTDWSNEMETVPSALVVTTPA